jgi:sec-independent protein translocase protein TatA
MPSGPEWIIVLVVVLVIFGGSQLPKLARNLGKAQKEFKDGLDEGKAESERPAVEPAQTRTETARAEQPRAEPATTDKPTEA